MLDPKVLNILEMAERGELPENVYYPHPNIAMSDHMIYGGKLCKKGAEMLAEHRQQAPESDLTTIHSQLGELKYKVEKMEAIVSKNPQVYGNFTTSCKCSYTKSEQPKLEWEVWGKYRSYEWELCCITDDKEKADWIYNMYQKEGDSLAIGSYKYKVRHNPKRKCTNESDQLREKLSEVGEQIIDLGKTIQTL